VRILTEENDIDFIFDSLNVRPTAVHLKGELRSERNPQSSKFEQSLWIYDSSLPDSSTLSEHITHIVNLLELKQGALDKIRARITTMDIFCMFSSEHGQGSAELDADILRRLADLRLNLIIDLYPPN